MKFESVPVNMIDVGDRRRAEFGDMEGLAAGIKRVGLLSPILVDRNGDGRFRLVFGERRLVAVKMLGWERIPAQLREHLSEEEFRDIEIEENENRKALTEGEKARTFASSKRLVEKAKKAAEVLREAPKTPNPKGGRPTKEAVSQEAIADSLGTSRRNIDRAQQHVATVEKYPFMESQHWRQSHVFAVNEHLEKLPEEEREPMMNLLAAAKLMDPALALRLIGNMAAKKDTERKRLYELSRSKDQRDVALAHTEAAELPPMPDPRLEPVEEIIRTLARMAKSYPNDAVTPQIEAVTASLRLIHLAIKQISFDAQRKVSVQ